jgi:hypothetical protein
MFILFRHRSTKYGYIIRSSFLTCFGSLSHHHVFQYVNNGHCRNTVYLSIYLSLCLSVYLSICLSVCLSICLSVALQPSVGPWPLFSFLIVYAVGRNTWTGDQLVARPLCLHTEQHKHRINAHTYIHPSSGIQPHDPQCSSGRRLLMP